MGKGDQNESLRLGIGVGDEIESCEDGKWYKAKVISIQTPGLEVTIHYKGWNSKWDKKIKLTSPSVRNVDYFFQFYFFVSGLKYFKTKISLELM